MNADEVVRALKICPGGCKECAYGSVALGCMGKSRLDAADLIESLTVQLAESHRRERAAVTDLQAAMPHWCCKNKGKGNCAISVYDGRFDCGYCGQFEWRGEQEDA
jgi:hypothetical protein